MLIKERLGVPEIIRRELREPGVGGGASRDPTGEGDEERSK